MTIASYTALAAGPLGLLIAILGTTISLRRLSGRGEGKDFERLVRVHANAVEHIPIILILLFLCELLRGPRWLLAAGAILAVVARVVHAVGYSIRRRHRLQFIGATGTYMLEGGLGLAVLVLVLIRSR